MALNVGWIIVFLSVIAIIVSIILLETTSSRAVPITVLVLGIIILLVGLLIAFASSSAKKGSELLKENPELLKLLLV